MHRFPLSSVVFTVVLLTALLSASQQAAAQRSRGGALLIEPRTIYEFQGTDAEYMVSPSPTSTVTPGTLRVSIDGEYRDTGLAVTSVALPAGQEVESQHGIIALPYHFAVFYGAKDVFVGLPRGLTMLESWTGLNQKVDRVTVRAFDSGHSALIRVYGRPDGIGRSDSRLMRVMIIARGLYFRANSSQLERLRQVWTEKFPRVSVFSDDATFLQLFMDDLTAAGRAEREPLFFSRTGLTAIDPVAVRSEPNPGQIVQATPLDFGGALPAGAPSAGPAGTALAVVPAQINRALGRDPLPTLVKVKDENGVMRPAIDIVRAFATDMLAEAAEKNWPYDDIPWLREIEDSIFRSWLKPEAGSVKLLGPSGVGKDFLMRRIAVRMLRGDCPEPFKNEHLWEFNAGAFSASASYRGQSEAKMLAVVALARSGRIKFSVSEGHVLAGAGASASSGNVMQIAKPTLATGEMKWVINTTPAEWEQAFGGDDALNRRFARVDIEEPKAERLEMILRGWWRHKGEGDVPAHVLQEIVRLADLYAVEGAQPSRSTSLLNEIVASRGMTGRTGPVTIEEARAEAIRLWHIPAEEFDAVLRLAKHDELMRELNENLIGQEQAKAVIGQQDRNVLARVNNPFLPRYRIVLLGPKGTGKSETGEIIARVKTGGEPSRIMLSDYKNAHQVPELKRQIATYANRNPQGVLFFDEVEKAHPDAQQALLSIWDKGELTVEYVNNGRVTTKLLRLHNMKVLVAGNAAESFILRLARTAGSRERNFRMGFQGSSSEAARPATGADAFREEAELRRAAAADGFDQYLLDRSDAIAIYRTPTLRQFTDVIRLHVRKALTEIGRHAGLVIGIRNSDAMVSELAESYFQEDGSNRDAIRVVSRTIRDTVANGRFELERASIAAGGTGAEVTGFDLEWRSGALNPAPATQAASPVVPPGAGPLRCAEVFALAQ